MSTAPVIELKKYVIGGSKFVCLRTNGARTAKVPVTIAQMRTILSELTPVCLLDSSLHNSDEIQGELADLISDFDDKLERLQDRVDEDEFLIETDDDEEESDAF